MPIQTHPQTQAQTPAQSQEQRVEFHNTRMGAIIISLSRTDPAGLADDMHKMLGGRPDTFNQEAAVLNFANIPTLPERIDWNGLISLMRRYRLQPVGVHNLSDEGHLAGARRAGLGLFDHLDSATHAIRPAPQDQAKTAHRPESSTQPQIAPVTQGEARPTQFVDKPVRSGQQIYAKGGDLVLLAGISPGSEVIADGNIQCFGPLAGRALAGAQGDANARIIATCFGPALVSVAGVYRTFERGVPEVIAGRPVVVRLKSTAKNQSIIIEPLQID